MAYYTSIALNQKDDPILTYYDYADAGSNTTLHLRSLFWTGSYWQSATVDRTPGSGKFNSIAIDSSGRPQIAYANVDAMHSGFRYATWDGKAWKVEIVEGADRPTPAYSLSMVLDNKDNPHVVYTDLAHRWIKYATRLNGKWSIQPIDSYVGAAEGQGYWDRNGILLDPEGNPYLSYFDKGTGVLKVAHRQGTRWLVEIVDSGMSGMTSSMAIANGELWVAYAALLEQSLKVAHRPLDGPVQTTLSEQRDSVSVRRGKDARDAHENEQR
jgi:hypothetical protein